MELALYCPDYGFYEREKDNIGLRGHYYTSVSVGTLFGELLASQFAHWFETAARSEGNQSLPLQIVEAGAHDGRLASDILNWLQTHRSDLMAHLEYCIVEPSPRRREWQERTLSPFREKVRWVPDTLAIAGAPASPRPFCIFFCNELLDAFPVHRLGWDAKAAKWFEWGVTSNRQRFEWARIADPVLPAGVAIPQLLADFGIDDVAAMLPDGFILDVCPSAPEWWGAAARSLGHGKLLTLDYGLTVGELLSPERKDGTLRAYRNHQLTTDLLADPGEQDLTAHVNFAAIQGAGETAGLRTESLETQEQFLTHILAQIVEREGTLPEWIASRKRQFQTLTHPDLMGRQFRVLIQAE